MSLVEKAISLVTGPTKPTGTIHVVDRNPLNWLYITYNTVEELVRVSPEGSNEPAAMKKYYWADDRTLEVELREDERSLNGEPLTSATVKRAFDQVMRWRSPHPPGTQFNLDSRTKLEVTGELSVRFHFPEPDGLAVGKLRAMHLMTPHFWDAIGFGYKRQGSGEGHW